MKRMQSELRKACLGGLSDVGVSGESVMLHMDDLGVWRFRVDRFLPCDAPINADLRSLQQISVQPRTPEISFTPCLK
jgi:hypothetical protein